MPTLTTGICTEKRNCWRISPARRASFLVDAADYFQAFAEAAEKAHHSIVILAWDINGRIRLRREFPEETVRGFFIRLLDAKPELHIYILSWNFPLVYADDRELLPMFDAPWRAHPRLHFLWDSQHPLGACHHQKVVVIDDQLAFVGGLDFTDERWDMPCHLGHDRRRHGFRVDFYKPFHDTTMVVQGDAARRLGDLARTRWRKAQGTPWPLVTHAPELWPDSVPIAAQNVQVAIARTEPALGGHPATREIEQLFEDAILSAQHSVYIENQYFTSHRVAQAVADRLNDPEGPEFIIILPKGCTGWIEEASLGVLRRRVIQRLLAQDSYGRLHFYYPTVDGLDQGNYIKVHSKVIIVDDRFLKIGSANVCNRSMGLDTECDLAIEATDEATAQAIRNFRNRLLAEHLGTTPATVAALLELRGSIAAVIQQDHRPNRRLVPFAGEVSPIWEWLIPRDILLDPEHSWESEKRLSRDLARQGKRRQAMGHLFHVVPFWLANLIAFPLLGFWILRKRLTRLVRTYV